MKFRKLRISCAVACGAAAVLLCVLWARSYWRMDWITLNAASNSLAATSMAGAINFSFTQQVVPHWAIKAWSRQLRADDRGLYSARTFLWNSDINLLVLVVPHWFLAAILALGTVFGTTRFSLRTLLVATTLFAAVLGLAVWAAG